MIFIAVKWRVRPELADQWLDDVAEFTAATRAEPGNLFFEWSRDVEDPSTFVLLEAFRDDAAGPHVESEHFRTAMAGLGSKLTERPEIVNFQVPGETWSRLGELQMED
jgi:quinol monooxygenase YgiN